VGVRHDEPAAGDPAAALDAEAAGGAEHAHDAARSRLDLAVARDGGVRGRHVRGGPRDRREGVEARQRLEERARGRQDGVELLEDRRPLDRLAELAGTRRLERHRARDPDEEEPQARDERAAAEAVERSEAVAQPVSQVEAEQLEHGRERAADEQGAHERHERRVGGLRAVREQQRAEP
jgi:hypothetical protein